MAKYSNSDVKKFTDEYLTGQDYLSDVEIEMNENNVDPLVLIRAANGPKTVDNLIPLTLALTKGQNVTFKKDGKTIFTVGVRSDTTEGSFSNLFIGQPMLMELLINVSYGLMLKKLTPPSNVLTRAAATPASEAPAQEKEAAPF